MDKLLTFTEAAVRIGVSQARVSQLVKLGRLEVERFEDDRAVRLRESVVDKYIAGREIPTALPAR